MSKLSRRETLIRLLGLPLVASAGCGGSRRKKAPLPPGELLGASPRIGHFLRDGLKVEPTEWKQNDVLIVGGGIAGLSAARRLQQGGLNDFALLELESAVGGTSRSGRSPLVGFPWGADYLPAPPRENKALLELLDEMDVFSGRDQRGDPLVKEQFLCRDPQERIFHEGEWHAGLYPKEGRSVSDEKQYEQFGAEMIRWSKWRDAAGRKAFTIPMAESSDDEQVTRLDQQSMADWMVARGWDSGRLRWYVDYACRDDYGLRLEQTSAWAGIFYYVSRMTDTGKTRPFITWPEGNGRLVAHLRGKIQDRIRAGWAVLGVDRQGPGERPLQIRAVSHDGKTALGYRAKRVIFAAPHFLVPFLLDKPGPHRQLARQFQYGAWAVVNLQLRRPPFSKGFPTAWDNVLYDSPSLGYVSATYQRGLDNDQQHLTYYYPLTNTDPREAREHLLNTDRESWVDVALTDLERAHPDIRDLVERADVVRWGHAMIQPRPGFIWGDARRRAAEPQDGVFFAHSDLSGVALFEEAFYRGVRAAEDVLKDLNLEVSSIL